MIIKICVLWFKICIRRNINIWPRSLLIRNHWSIIKRSGLGRYSIQLKAAFLLPSTSSGGPFLICRQKERMSEALNNLFELIFYQLLNHKAASFLHASSNSEIARAVLRYLRCILSPSQLRLSTSPAWFLILYWTNLSFAGFSSMQRTTEEIRLEKISFWWHRWDIEMCLISSPICTGEKCSAAEGRRSLANMQSAQLTELIHYVCNDLFDDNVYSCCPKQKHIC